MSRNMFVVLQRKKTDDGWGEETEKIVVDGRFGKDFVKDEGDVLYRFKAEIEDAGGREAVKIVLHPFGT